MRDTNLAHYVAKRIRRKDVVFFIGAGVSYFSPSNLPSGMELKNSVLNAICGDDDFIHDQLIGPYHDQSSFTGRLDRLSPERVFESIYEVAAEDLASLFTSFRGGIANHHHRLIAECIRRAWLTTVITTNFDGLIEEAVAEFGNVPLFIGRSESDFANSHRGPALYKLHGSAENPASIMTTLSQTGRHLSSAKYELLKKCLETKTVIFVGYSGYDFDIMEVALAAKLKAVYWIVRPGSDAFQAPLLSLLKTTRNCHFIEYDLNDWFRDLGLELRLCPDVPPSQDHNLDPRFQQVVGQAASRFNKNQLILMVAKVLVQLWEYEKAIGCCQRLLEGIGSSIEVKPLEEADIHRTIARAYRSMHQLKDSYEHYSKAFKIFEKKREYRAFLAAGLDIAWIWELAGKPEIAQGYYQRIISGLFEMVDRGEATAHEPDFLRAYLGLGRVDVAQGRTEEGYEMIRLAQEGARRQGSIEPLRETALWVAQMHAAKGEWMTAAEHCREALRIAYVIGDCFAVHNTARLLATIYVRTDQSERAPRVLAEADNYLSLWDFDAETFDRPWFDKQPRIFTFFETLFGGNPQQLS